MKRVWDNRFAGRREDPALEAFNASIGQDAFLAPDEIAASAAYAAALGRAGVLTAREAARIRAGLGRVGRRIAAGEDLAAYEDIHSAVELMLIEEIGPAGRKLHTGRSRNEQVATDERLFLKRRIPEILDRIRACQRALVALAEAYPDVILPGYTHLQQAQFVLFPHYVLSHFWPLERAKARLADALKRIDVLPLGSGALAGTTAPIDRAFLARALDFAAVSENSLDAVADRGFILETLSALALLLVDIGRAADDVVLFSSREFGYLVLDDALATSSSLMPQKRNPDIFELLRAGAGRMFGHLARLFVTIKGLPSTYNKDLQDDKGPLREGIADALRSLEVYGIALRGIRPDPAAIARRAEPFLFATDLADTLAARGVPFREAHAAVGALVRAAERDGRPLTAYTLAELRAFHPAFGPDALRAFDPRRSVGRKAVPGSTHPARVKAQLRKAKALCRA